MECVEDLLDILKTTQLVEHGKDVAILERRGGLELCVLWTYERWRKETMALVPLGLKLLGDERATYSDREARR